VYLPFFEINVVCTERKYMLKSAVRDYKDSTKADLPSNHYKLMDMEANETLQHSNYSPAEIALVNRNVSGLGQDSSSKASQSQGAASKTEPSTSDMSISPLYASQIISNPAAANSSSTSPHL
jgi:hypothetical protein